MFQLNGAGNYMIGTKKNMRVPVGNDEQQFNSVEPRGAADASGRGMKPRLGTMPTAKCVHLPASQTGLDRYSISEHQKQ
jgi:hypothetical protein